MGVSGMVLGLSGERYVCQGIIVAAFCLVLQGCCFSNWLDVACLLYPFLGETPRLDQQ